MRGVLFEDEVPVEKGHIAGSIFNEIKVEAGFGTFSWDYNQVLDQNPPEIASRLRAAAAKIEKDQ